MKIYLAGNFEFMGNIKLEKKTLKKYKWKRLYSFFYNDFRKHTLKDLIYLRKKNKK